MSLEAQHISHAYVPGQPVLQDVSFELEPGKILYVLGRNGSGKTTLLSALSGILKPTKGRVLLHGKNIFKYPPAERAQQIGLIPQIHVPAFAYTVEQIVLMGRTPHLKLLSTPDREDERIAEQALDNVGMFEHRHRPYTELSGGERQLVMIARGLAQQCHILLMDEPGAHLDPNNQYRVLEIVARLSREGLSFVVSSHAPNNALIYADKVLLLKQGRPPLAMGPASSTLTESLLSAVYSMDTEVIYDDNDGSRKPKAILPRRPTFDGVSMASPDLSAPPLNEMLAESKNTPQIVLITGPSGIGKSTWCAGLIRRAREEGLIVRGILSPAVFVDGHKLGIDMIDLASGDRRRLANLRNPDSTGVMTDRWEFDSDVLDWGNQVLGSLAPHDLLIVDELGPLEFTRNQGLLNGLAAIDRLSYRIACVVVRPSLISDAKKRWPGAKIIRINGAQE